VRELFQRIRDDDKRSMLASSGKEEDTKYYIKDLLKIDDLIEGYTCADDADRSKPAPDIFTAALDKLGEMSPDRAIQLGTRASTSKLRPKPGWRQSASSAAGAPKMFYAT